MKILKDEILQSLTKSDCLTATELMARFKVSRQAIHRHLSALIREGKVLKQGSSRQTAFYVLNDPRALRRLGGRIRKFHKRIRALGASEDAVMTEIEAQAGLLAGLNEAARGNLRFAFTEMLNNAIDHSETALIDCDVAVGGTVVTVVVRDTGVGAFARLQQQLGLGSELEAIEDLLKGKQTTMPERHSGEGIFFTSKVVERFVLESHRKRLIVDNRIDDVFIEDIRLLKGTKVTCEIDLRTSRELTAIFREYTGEEFAFDRTKVLVRLIESGGSYVSRSQAKRLLHTLERFSEITLDFAGVASVGQGFADEIFRVFQLAHPGIRFLPINMNENVELMVRRARH